MLAIMESARVGLMPDNREAVLIKYGKHAEFMPMVQGIVNLMLRSPGVLKAEARVVYEGDEFDYEYGLRPRLVHKPVAGVDERMVTYSYAIVWREATEETFEVLHRDEIERARLTSRAPTSPAWKTWYGEMARKVALKRLSKYIDLSPEAKRAIEVDHAVTGMVDVEPAVDAVSDEYTSQLVRNKTEQGIVDLKERLSEEEEDEPEEKPKDSPLFDTPEFKKAENQKADLRSLADEHRGAKKTFLMRADMTLWKFSNWMLGKCFEGDKEAVGKKRSMVVGWVFGCDVESMTGAMCRALLDVLEVGNDDEPSKKGIATARLLLDAAVLASNQVELASA
ncbi:hypothetical protein ES705_18368 [subsurface metagenome]